MKALVLGAILVVSAGALFTVAAVATTFDKLLNRR